MKKWLIGAVVGVLGLTSIASADRYSRRGHSDRYDRQRYEASIRYERGSRNYDRTYVRYGQDNYNRRPSYDRDYVRRIDRGGYYVNGRAQRSNWGFSFGYGFSSGYAGDSVNLGIYYSNRPSVRYRYPGYSYDCAPDVYETRVYRAPSVYYYAPRSSYYSGSYYCR
jgi:opacity protein-like surface antigen